MVLTIFNEPVLRRYRAPLCSLSCFFNLLVVVGMILVPFYIAFASRNFWLTTNILYEQPNVRFGHDMIVILEGFSSGMGDAVQTWAWATRPEVRDVYEPFLRAPVIRAARTDENGDDLADTWVISVQMPLEAGDRVLSAQAIMFFDYALEGAAKLNMDAAVFVQHSSPIPGMGLAVEGEARLHQRRLLSVRRENANPENRFGAVEPQGFVLGPDSMRDHSVAAIVAGYAARNYTMELANVYQVWSTASSVMDAYGNTAESFVLNFTLHVPTDELVYTPDAAEMLKYAWIQYFSLFALFYFLFNALQSFVFTNQMLETIVVNEGTSKFSKLKQHRF